MAEPRPVLSPGSLQNLGSGPVCDTYSVSNKSHMNLAPTSEHGTSLGSTPKIKDGNHMMQELFLQE